MDFLKDIAFQFWSLISSLEAIRIYVLVGGLLALGRSVLFAYRQFVFLQDLEDPIEFIEARIRSDGARRGRLAVTREAVERRLNRIAAAKKRAWIAVGTRFVLLLFFGYAIPFALLVIGIRYYEFLMDSEHAALVIANTTVEQHKLPLPSIIGFVFDQFARGAAFDYIEVYKIADITRYEPNSDAFGMRPICLFFRAFVGAFSGIIPLFAFRALKAWATLNVPLFQKTA